MTVAIHLIWSTYDTWLPGDSRGHWAPLFDMYGHLIERGHKLNVPDRTTLQISAMYLKESERILLSHEEQMVADVIAEEADALDLRAYALAIERTHVHLLIGATPHEVGRVAGRMKSRSSSALCASYPENRTRTWSTSYWKVFLFEYDAVPVVQKYIESHNVWRGLPARRFDWITPFHI